MMDVISEQKFLDGRVIVKVGDITREKCDAIVNAANMTLMGGGGVDGAIHRTGGPAILEECQKIRETKFPNGLPTGQAIITSGGNLPATYVIHTVGPIWHSGKSGESEKLTQCYENCMKIAMGKKLSTIAFPAISTGSYGYPPGKAAHVASAIIKDFLMGHNFPTQVIMVFFSEADMRLFLENQVF